MTDGERWKRWNQQNLLEDWLPRQHEGEKYMKLSFLALTLGGWGRHSWTWGHRRRSRSGRRDGDDGTHIEKSKCELSVGQPHVKTHHEGCLKLQEIQRKHNNHYHLQSGSIHEVHHMHYIQYNLHLQQDHSELRKFQQHTQKVK